MFADDDDGDENVGYSFQCEFYTCRMNHCFDFYNLSYSYYRYQRFMLVMLILPNYASF